MEASMTTGVLQRAGATPEKLASRRTRALAGRLEQGARALETAVSTLTEAEWQISIPGDGRSVGVVVHHVASMYPLEIELAQQLAAGTPIVGVTVEVVNGINARHAKEHRGVTKEEALDLLRRNSAAATAAIRALSVEDLDRAAPVSLYANAPLTCQFFLEDHQLARIRAVRPASAAQLTQPGER
jgi:hypothetical protein